MASCVTICAFAPETRRSHQMLLCMQSILPHLLLHMEEESNNAATAASSKNGGVGGSSSHRSHSAGMTGSSSTFAAIKHELAAFATLGVEMRALANSCDVLARGPTRSLDFLSASGASNAFSTAVRERKSRSFLATNERADSPQFFDPPTIIDDEPSKQQQTGGQSHSSGGVGGINSTGGGKPKLTVAGWADSGTTADIEIHKEQFRGPRDALLTLCAMFIHRGSIRLKELSKLLASGSGQSEHSPRVPELLDHRCHSKISEVAVALLKLAPYDSQTLTCNGLRDYFTHVLPIVDWSVETNRSSINVILRRLDKTIVKIAKRPSIRRSAANWEAVSCWLAGLYQTLLHSPHIAHLHSLKTITLLCLRLTLGDTLGPMEEPTGPQQPHISTPVYSHTVLNSHIPPPTFCSVALRLFTVWGESQRLGHFGAQVFSLEVICTTEAIGPLSERPEALFCQFLIPMFLRAAIPGKASPKFHSKDLHFCLHLLQQAICPPLVSKQSVVPMAVSGSSLANSLMRENTGGIGGGTGGGGGNVGGYRQGSVYVTEKGGFSATVSTARIVRDSVALAVILVREMVAKKCGGSALGTFLEAMICSNLPIAEMLQPLMQIRLSQRPANDLDASWQSEMRERLLAIKQLKGEDSSIISTQYSNKTFSSTFNIFYQLQILRKELLLLREDFANRSLEIPRSHTPTIGGEIHSDSGSSGTGTRESRRLSSSAALGKLRWIQPSRSGGDEKIAKKSLSSQQQENNTTIMEMEETIGDDGIIDNAPTTSVQQRVNKSPSLPFSARSSTLRASGIRRKTPPTRMPSADSSATTSTGLGKVSNKLEMREVSQEVGRRTKSLRSPGGRFAISMGEESSTIGRNVPTEPSTPSISSLAHGSTGERPRVVSFSTPRHSSISETISEADSETEFCITSTKHLI
uniref:UNC80_C domain-containing protein n=1 Tax=Meloidogyne hapla TaxID=6305 RepID=A0A1I8BXJ5_MELHA